mmetsp:Transcript_32147/g.60557  ORF Transcript_32147/g.60557 Transcript_32147/m.60557 type:complete len:106 (-) Transcript_32147:21-338(-)
MGEEDISTKMESLTVSADEKKWDDMDFPEDRIDFLRKRFQEHPDAVELEGKKALAPKLVHQLLFTQEERKEYGFKDFEGDAAAALIDVDKPFSWEDVEKFMEKSL